MLKQYSIDSAQDHLPEIVREAECGSPVELTREDEPVAVVLSVQEYDRLGRGLPNGTSMPKRGGGDLWEAIQKFRREADLEAIWADGDPFEGIRDKSPTGGREEFRW